MSMVTPLMSKAGATSTTLTRYIPLSANSAVGWTTVANVECPVGGTYVFQNLTLALNVAPGVGNTSTFTLMKNNLATALTASVTGAGLTASDTTDTVTAAPGDTLNWAISVSGTPASANLQISCEIVGLGQPLFTGGNASISNSVPSYLPMSGGTTSTVLSQAETTWPTAGVINNLYIKQASAAGSSKTITYTLYQNGSPTALTTSITGTSQVTNSDTSHSITVAAGDKLYWQIDPTSTPTASIPKIGCVFTPTTDGESVHISATGAAMNTGALTYNMVGGGTTSVSWSATEPGRQTIYPSSTGTMKKLYVNTGTNPGAAASGKKYAFMLRQNAGDTGITCDVLETATSNNDTTHTVSLTTNDLIAIKETPTSTPTSTYGEIGFVIFQTPSVSTVSTYRTLTGAGA